MCVVCCGIIIYCLCNIWRKSSDEKMTHKLLNNKDELSIHDSKDQCLPKFCEKIIEIEEEKINAA